jgi:GT2 family glycosyltransferase
MQISVVVCTHAVDRYPDLREAVESVLASTYDQDQYDVVVVSDGSPAVAERAREDFGSNPAVSVLELDENRGVSAARTRGGMYATGDVVAFIDDDALVSDTWLEQLAEVYEERDDVLAAGGRMEGEWIGGEPAWLPEEFYWLVGVTHRGFPTEEGFVRNTFGSNISYRAAVFEELGGFSPEFGGTEEKNFQGEDAELPIRLGQAYDTGVYYLPDAVVYHKVYPYRTRLGWLLRRAFWQGYAKARLARVQSGIGSEQDFLSDLVFRFVPDRVGTLARRPSLARVGQLVMLFVFTGVVGMGYVYGVLD